MWAGLDYLGGVDAIQLVSNAAAAERQTILSAVRDAVNKTLADGLDAPLHCASPTVRNLCVAVEAALEYQLHPPLFSLAAPGLWLALAQLRQLLHRSASKGAAAQSRAAQQLGEAIALARGLSEKQLSTLGEVPAAAKDAYAARLWLCLALQRRVLAEWLVVLQQALPQFYAEVALLRSEDDFQLLLDLVTPLQHLRFSLVERPPASLAAYLALPDVSLTATHDAKPPPSAPQGEPGQSRPPPKDSPPPPHRTEEATIAPPTAPEKDASTTPSQRQGKARPHSHRRKPPKSVEILAADAVTPAARLHSPGVATAPSPISLTARSFASAASSSSASPSSTPSRAATPPPLPSSARHSPEPRRESYLDKFASYLDNKIAYLDQVATRAIVRQADDAAAEPREPTCRTDATSGSGRTGEYLEKLTSIIDRFAPTPSSFVAPLEQTEGEVARQAAGGRRQGAVGAGDADDVRRVADGGNARGKGCVRREVGVDRWGSNASEEQRRDDEKGEEGTKHLWDRREAQPMGRVGVVGDDAGEPAASLGYSFADEHEERMPSHLDTEAAGGVAEETEEREEPAAGMDLEAAASEEAPSVGAASVEAALVEAASVEAVAEEGALVEAASVEAVAEEGALVEAASVEAVAEEGALVEAASVEAVAEDAAFIVAAALDAAALDAAALDAAALDAAALDTVVEGANAVELLAVETETRLDEEVEDVKAAEVAPALKTHCEEASNEATEAAKGEAEVMAQNLDAAAVGSEDMSAGVDHAGVEEEHHAGLVADSLEAGEGSRGDGEAPLDRAVASQVARCFRAEMERAKAELRGCDDAWAASFGEVVFASLHSRGDDETAAAPPELPAPLAEKAVWLPLRALVAAGAYDARGAVVLRRTAACLSVAWARLCREADAFLEHALNPSGEGLELLHADASDGWARERLLGRSAHTDRLELGKCASSPIALRQVSTRCGLQQMVCVSGLLSRNEGDMELRKQPLQLSSCWAAAAAYFEAAEWWSLSWGGVELEALSRALHAAGAIQSLPQALGVRPQWSGCYDAAKVAGTKLATHLRDRGGGCRPACLLGASLGARVVWHCLELLSELPENQGCGLVQDVVLVAAPVTANPARWERVAAVVAGRLVNAYFPNDAQLALLYRSDHLASKGCCGTQPVPWDRVENLDATAFVAHASESYHFAVPAILDEARII